MQCYHAMEMGHPNKTPVRSFASELHQGIIVLLEKASVQTKTENASVQVITRLLSSWTTFSASARNCGSGSAKYDKYNKMLDEMCDLATAD